MFATETQSVESSPKPDPKFQRREENGRIIYDFTGVSPTDLHHDDVANLFGEIRRMRLNQDDVHIINADAVKHRLQMRDIESVAKIIPQKQEKKHDPKGIPSTINISR
jgi:hypothetical protein